MAAIRVKMKILKSKGHKELDMYNDCLSDGGEVLLFVLLVDK